MTNQYTWFEQHCNLDSVIFTVRKYFINKITEGNTSPEHGKLSGACYWSLISSQIYNDTDH